MEPILSARSLTKLYGLVIGVNDVTLDLPRGVRGLLGPNGAGKSTFLKLVTGQLRPTEGEVLVFGERPWSHPELFRRIGFCPEQDAFWDFLTAREFVAALARMSGLDAATAERKAEEALDRCGATSFMDRKIGGYSKGMRQRAKVAQALVHDPELVILDEPLSGTDPVGRHELIELVKKLGREGKSVLISSHVLHEVEAMTEDFLLIHSGRVLASGNVHEIRGLMNDYPHRITIKAKDVRGLARAVVRDLPVAGVNVDEAAGSLLVLTREPKLFYEGLTRLAAEGGVREVVSQDDNLDAVFNYLVTRS
ncbi:MAG TPA: ABC transporter ATP-binding protein [Planctomycetota bacterium]